MVENYIDPFKCVPLSKRSVHIPNKSEGWIIFKVHKLVWPYMAVTSAGKSVLDMSLVLAFFLFNCWWGVFRQELSILVLCLIHDWFGSAYLTSLISLANFASTVLHVKSVWYVAYMTYNTYRWTKPHAKCDDVRNALSATMNKAETQCQQLLPDHSHLKQPR